MDQLYEVILDVITRLTDEELKGLNEAVRAEQGQRYYDSLCPCCEQEEYINARNVQ